MAEEQPVLGTKPVTFRVNRYQHSRPALTILLFRIGRCLSVLPPEGDNII